MKTTLSILIFLTSFAAHAGDPWAATVIEQLIQSSLLGDQLGKQASMVIQQATMIQNQLEQKNELLLLNKSQDPVVLNNMLNRNTQDINSLQTYIGGLAAIRNDSEQQRSAVQARLIDVRQSGLSYSEYEQMERDRIAAGDRRRAQVAAHEIAIMQNLNNDAQFIQEMQNKIPATVGAHEATQLMSVQLNRIIAQNATMIQLMVSGSGQGGGQSEDAQDESHRKNVLRSAIGAANERERAWTNGEIDKLNTSPSRQTSSSAAPQPPTEAQRRSLDF